MFPGTTPEEMGRRTRLLFWKYCNECSRLGMGRPIHWMDTNLMELLYYKMEHQSLGLDQDLGNELGLITERMILRRVVQVVPQFEVDVPFRISDLNHVKFANPVALWEMSRVLN